MQRAFARDGITPRYAGTSGGQDCDRNRRGADAAHVVNIDILLTCFYKPVTQVKRIRFATAQCAEDNGQVQHCRLVDDHAQHGTTNATTLKPRQDIQMIEQKMIGADARYRTTGTEPIDEDMLRACGIEVV